MSLYDDEFGGLAFSDGPRTASPPTVHAHPTPTEARAADRAKTICEPLRVLVLKWIRAAGASGMTPPELGCLYAQARGEGPSARREYSVRPRITELAASGFVCDSGKARAGCIVWIATDKTGNGRDLAPRAPRVHHKAVTKALRELLAAARAHIRHRGDETHGTPCACPACLAMAAAEAALTPR